LKILYFYQYFSTPKGSWGTRVYEFASQWVKEGHDVTVVTSVYAKSDISTTQFIDNQIIEGIKVKVLNISIDNKQSIIERVQSFLQYAIISSWYALTLKADIVIASSGPITVGIPGLIAKYFRRRKLVFETRDLWPEGAIQLGMIKNQVLIRLCYWFEKICYKSSDLIVTLSPGMQTYIKEKHKYGNIISVTNAANIELFSTPKLFPEGYLFLKPRKYAIYTGNIGEVNNSCWLLDAAAELSQRGRNDLVILLIGEGKLREELELAAKHKKLTNFFRLGLIPKEQLVPLLQHALVSLVPLKGTPILDTSSPNKFFESLAAGVPVIQNTKGWMKEFLEKHAIGFTIDPNRPDLLAECLIDIDNNPSLLDSMRPNAMSIAQQEFDKNNLAQKMLTSMSKLFN
jgi:glycosyltransferase involved in cell wall biosynthesis